MNYVRSDKETKVLLLYTRKFQCTYEFGEPVKYIQCLKEPLGDAKKKCEII